MSDYIEPYFIQPGDEGITFELPLNLREIKTLHNNVARQYDQDLKQGFIGEFTETMLIKLDRLIIYLQKEHYQNL